MSAKTELAITNEFKFLVSRENLDEAQKKELAGHCMEFLHCSTKADLKEYLGLSQLSDEVIAQALKVAH